MQRVEAGPDEQIQDEEDCDLVEAAYEAVFLQALQAEQRESAPQIPEQPGAQAVGV
jgi:hypothetical protein